MPFIGAKSYDSINVTVEQRTNSYVRPLEYTEPDIIDILEPIGG